jgi:HEAT repeat protein
MDEAQNLTAASSGTGPAGTIDGVDRETGSVIEEFVTALLKDLRARQAYVPSNPLIDRFHHAVRGQALQLWEILSHLTLQIDEGRLLWRDALVYDHPIGHDNVAFMFFRDGLRTIAFLPGCELGELREFLELIARVRQGRATDLLATLWHRDFSFIRIEYVDVSEDETLELPVLDRNAGAGEQVPTDEIEAVLEAGPVSETVEEAFAALLLTEADQSYLQREMDLELSRPLAHDVTLALLDQFEMRDQERRRQVVDILRELLPRLLRVPDFATVSLIVNELQLLANKTGERDTQELVASLLRDMSEAMAELVSLTAEGVAEGPEDAELEALLGALQAEAIPTLVRALPAISDVALRAQVEEALDRLVDRFPNQVTSLLLAEDPMLAAEAAGMVARLRLVNATGALIDAAARPELAARRAAVAALGRMPGEAVTATLQSALSDEETAVRVAAADALALLGDPEAAAQLSAAVTSRGFAHRDQVEQMSFLKAYVRVTGPAAVPTLSRMLNGRRWWGGRHSPALRAGAARALAIVATRQAADELGKAEGDRVSTVAHAVRISLRHIEHGPGPLPGVNDSPPGATSGSSSEESIVVRPEVEHVSEGGP